MENIYEPNTSFPFSQLHFISPTAVAGGNYFIRCLTGKQSPLYIQPPKCHSKNGIVKTGKRMYIDLVFHHEDEAFIEWMEKMENLCQTKIFDNREKWFESGLEMHDIENSFTPAMKIYKSGKMYVIRANIPVRLGKCGLKIYDEQENDVDPESIADTTPLMTILEIQGVKCSSRSFQLELEVKQMMKLSPSNLFESCVFSKVKKSDSPVPKDSLVPQSTETDTKPSDMQMVLVEDVKLDEDVEDVEDVESENHVKTKNLEKVEVNLEAEPTNPVLSLPQDQDLEPVEVNLDSDLVGTTTTSNNTIMDADEIDFPLDESSTEVVKLKHKDDVYFEMYKNAKRKAKIARDIALSAYLEAKQIKNTYLIHGQEDEEDDDNEENEETELRNMEKSIEESMEDKKIL